MKPEFSIDDRKFSDAIGRLVAVTKQGREKIVRQEFRRVMRNVIGFTPPLNEDFRKNGTPNFQKGRQRSDEAIEADLSNAFEVVRGKGAAKIVEKDGRGNLEFYLQLRNKRKRVKAKVHAPILASVRAQIKKEIRRRVGWTLAGWESACSSLGVALPSWVRGKGGGPGSTMRFDREACSFYAVNHTSHTDSKRIQSRVDAAISDAIGTIEKQIEYHTKQAGKEFFK